MPKNIIIFSDGTGQRSGIKFEEIRTNIYKLYRAAKAGPDTTVDPNKQYAFYDPGIGTIPPKSGPLGASFAWVYNLICQATGLGLTHNIKDCYKAIISHYEPGDRIFLFGFSRGAYTVRCLAAVLHFCGIPTTTSNGIPLSRDPKTLDSLAKEAVENVYQHVGSPNDKAYIEQRKALGERFRKNYSSVTSYPHFIGVFDTVAAVASYTSMIVLALITVCVLAILAFIGTRFLGGGYGMWFIGLCILCSTVGLFAYIRTHFKIAFGLPGFHWYKTMHFNQLHMEFYDKTLNINVGWARHALAIDEHRKDFDRVPWCNSNEVRTIPASQPEWLKQIWFAGNHADIGGGYPEPESRLSDAALKWMIEEAQAIPDGILVDQSVLRTYPSESGIQHDETRGFPFKFAAKTNRDIQPDAPLDPFVLKRMALTSVRQMYEDRPYRPENLRGHSQVSQYYIQS